MFWVDNSGVFIKKEKNGTFLANPRADVPLL